MPEPRIFFTADNHFFHRGIIGHANRPFKDVDEMNAGMADAINGRVEERDILYHLGDFAWNRGDIAAALKMIQCKNVHLIVGNHDEKGGVKKALESGALKTANEFLYLRARGHKFVLCHYALQTWRRGWFMLHGHSHGGLAGKPMRLDVGIDTTGRNGCTLRPLPYRGFGEPWTLEQVVDILGPERPIDQAGDRGESEDL